MTVVAVLAEPPREGLVLSELAETTPLTEAETAELYEAMFRDTISAIHRSGGELLVNYRPEESIPAAHQQDIAPEAELRAIVADTIDDVGSVRFEPQVGSTYAARVGNTVTHLLREEGAQSVAAVPGTAPLMVRSVIDTAAMRLRTNEVVLGPSLDGRVYYAGFTEPIDFTDGYDAPALETLSQRASDAELDTDFLAMQPVVERGADLETLIPQLRARFTAERIVPTYTASFVYDYGLVVAETDGERSIVVDRSSVDESSS